MAIIKLKERNKKIKNNPIVSSKKEKEQEIIKLQEEFYEKKIHVVDEFLTEFHKYIFTKREILGLTLDILDLLRSNGFNMKKVNIKKLIENRNYPMIPRLHCIEPMKKSQIDFSQFGLEDENNY